ncbi:ABC transporter permease [Paratissierella segnis]|uniref:ABC transporter permease n=1 Tax=Paratissierella segnis TaxID=2763679 RepID=A0A926EYN2_9FIRM|nr:ABC transporter permease [Paratissierella segnis]MBC8588922.1 ABC transporter permease [Paratissierella segnis]
MSNIDLVRMGIKNLWRRKLRTFLTVLGVMIGTSSIVVMLSLGFGLSESFTEQISQWGSLTTINVYKRWQDPSMPKQKESKLDETAVLAFKAIPNVEAVSPTLETYGTIKTGRYVANVPIKGIVPEAMEAFGFEVQEGRLLNDNDELTILFGGGMSNNFYDPKSRVWREPKIDLMKDRFTFTFDQDMGYNYGGGMGNEKPNYKEYKIKVAGVLTEGNWETNYGVYMPLREVQKLMVEKAKAEDPKSRPSKETEYEQINVKVNDMKNVQAVQDAIKDLGHEAYSLNDQLESMKKTAGTIQMVLGGIGAVSLIVAAIGITNTMVMSIYERTKEIGVMKVIGASIKDIKRLFLLESTMIGIIGGVFGVALSYILSFFVNKFSGVFGDFLGTGGESKISIIPIWLIFAATAFSALIGILSGYFPAKRAMNLSALEAIRTE